MAERRRWGWVPVALAVFVVVPVGLVRVGFARLGSWSPLTGMDPPWRWSMTSVRGWLRHLTDGLDTSDQLVDLFVRVALVVAWACIVVIFVSTLLEVIYQLRHGMPSAHRRLGTGRLGRYLAAGVISLLVLSSSASAQASIAPLVARAPAVATGPGATVRPNVTPHVAGVERSAAPSVVHRVVAGESVWSIAQRYAPHTADVDEVAASIVDANIGRMMPDGARFVTPALIEPGWELVLPDDIAAAWAAHGRGTATTPDEPVDEHVDEDVEVRRGDSYWRLSEAHLRSHGADAAPREVLDLTLETMAHNAPRLGYRDPAMLHPGDVVEFAHDPLVTDTDDANVDVDRDVDDAADAPTPPPETAPTPGAAPPSEVTSVPEQVPGPDAEPTESPQVVTTPERAPDPPLVIDHRAPTVPTTTPTAPAGDQPAPGAELPPEPSSTSPSATSPTSPDGPATGTPPNTVPVGTELSVPHTVPLGGAVVVATGALALIEARRRRRLRTLRMGERLAAMPREVQNLERSLRAIDDHERIALLDVAVRAAAVDLVVQHVGVLAAAVAADGSVGVWPSAAALPVDRRWEYDDDSGVWRLPAGLDLVDVAADARRAAQPCPTLVHLGQVTEPGEDAAVAATATWLEGAEFFVDVEAIGVLGIEGHPGLLGTIAAGLALSPIDDTVEVITLGVELPDAFTVERAASFDDAIHHLRSRSSTIAELAGGRSTFSLRVAMPAGGDLDPLVVVAAGVDGATPDIEPACGVALVVDRTVSEGANVRVLSDGCCVLQPLGVCFDPAAVATEPLAMIGTALELADAPPEVPTHLPMDTDTGTGAVTDADVDGVAAAGTGVVAETTLDTVTPVDAGTDVAGDVESPIERSFVVRLYGPVMVETAVGERVVFGRSKSEELVVWLSRHRERATRQAARTALWDLDVRDATFSNVVSEARRALARAVAPADGQEWVGRTLTERLPLHPGVSTDVDVIEQLRRHAHAHPETARDALREALSWARGAPLEGSAYLWPDAEGLTSHLVIVATEVAVELAQAALAAGDEDLAFWATERGLAVLPGHEQLVALRMRAHHQRGNLAGVRVEWESYERALRADAWSDGEPSPMLAGLRRELMAAVDG